MYLIFHYGSYGPTYLFSKFTEQYKCGTQLYIEVAEQGWKETVDKVSICNTYSSVSLLIFDFVLFLIYYGHFTGKDKCLRKYLTEKKQLCNILNMTL